MEQYPRSMDPYARSRYEQGIDSKIVIMGNSGVGKTSLLQRYTQNKFDPKNTTSTSGAFFITKKVYVNGLKVRLQLWDTGGQERFRSMAPMYCRGANAALLLYDITNASTFDDIRGWLEELKKNCQPELIIYIVGSKADLSPHRQVTSDLVRLSLHNWFPPPRPPTPPPPPPPPTSTTLIQQQLSTLSYIRPFPSIRSPTSPPTSASTSNSRSPASPDAPAAYLDVQRPVTRSSDAATATNPTGVARSNSLASSSARPRLSTTSSRSTTGSKQSTASRFSSDFGGMAGGGGWTELPDSSANMNTNTNSNCLNDDDDDDREWGLSKGMELFEVSAKDDLGIQSLFDHLISAIIVRKDRIEQDNGANVNTQVNVVNEEVGGKQETSLSDPESVAENRADIGLQGANVDHEIGSANTASLLSDSDSMVALPIENGANVNAVDSEIGGANTASLSDFDSVVVLPIENGHMLDGEYESTKSAPGSEESSMQLFIENSADGRVNITLFLRDVIDQPDIALILPLADCRSWPTFRKWVLKQRMLGLSDSEAGEFVVRLTHSRQILFEMEWDGWISSLRYQPNVEIGLELCFIRDACECVQPIDNGNGSCDKCGVQFLLEEPATAEHGAIPQEDGGGHGENEGNDKGEDEDRTEEDADEDGAKEEANHTDEEGNGTALEGNARAPGLNAMGKKDEEDESKKQVVKNNETEEPVQVNRSQLNSVMRRRKLHLTLDEHQGHSSHRLDDALDDDKKLVRPTRRWAWPRARDVVNSVTRFSNAVHEFVIAPPFLDGQGTWDQKRLDTRLNALQGWAWPVHGVLLAAAVAILALSSISTYAVSQSFVILSGLFALFGLIYTVLLIFLIGDRNICFPKAVC
ncbi:hypothetical protein C8J57DRAFT_1676031 [Mycena rebaudengoi]|nr:hypothetical protein C8J57DRAFT_1676031 [Mycena rebaudengoi]